MNIMLIYKKRIGSSSGNMKIFEVIRMEPAAALAILRAPAVL